MKNFHRFLIVAITVGVLLAGISNISWADPGSQVAHHAHHKKVHHRHHKKKHHHHAHGHI